MRVRDDVRLAVEMERGLLDTFVRRRLTLLDNLRAIGYDDDFIYGEWLYFGNFQTFDGWMQGRERQVEDRPTICGIPIVWVPSFSEPQTFVGLAE